MEPVKLDLNTLEMYLDGALVGAQKSAVERALGQDASADGLLRRLESQRALRAAAMASYQPSAGEASAHTAAFLEQCADEAAAPVGRIVPAWSRRLGGIAAMLLVSVGCICFGRTTVAPQVVTHEVVKDRFVVNIVTPTGEVTQHTFASRDDMSKFVAEVQRMQNGTVVAGVM